MKILLIGKNGQVGWELQRSLSTLGELVAVDFFDKTLCGDLTDPEGIAQTIRTVKPDVVVNAAAHTAVDKAESERELSQLLNADSVEVIAKETARLGALLIHYSTDYVFNGGGEHYRQEDEQPAPLNVYGETKLAGELAIARHNPRHFIFRTSWVYATRGANFAKPCFAWQKRKRVCPLSTISMAPRRVQSCWLTARRQRSVLSAIINRCTAPIIWWQAVKQPGTTMRNMCLQLPLTWVKR